MNWDMPYNTEKDNLLISEYGRLVQELLAKVNSEEDDEKRQLFAERVIKLMLQMQPQIKQQEDYKSRLWRHAFRIQPDLNVTVPEGIDVSPKALDEKNELLEYPYKPIPMRHYGSHVKQLIDATILLEDGPKKDYAIQSIAYYMKVAYTTWSGDNFVNEDIIRADLFELSDRKLVLDPNVRLGKPRDNQPAQHADRRKGKNKNKNYRNRRNRRRR